MPTQSSSAQEAGVTRYRLSNGLTLLVKPDHTAPVVAIVTYVKAGYFDETDDVNGIAHVLEHMYFKGTPTRGVGEIARQTKASGGYLNASTIYDHTRYYAVLPSSGFEAGLAIQADAYANSLIDADELRRELEVIIQEAHRKADSPEAVTTESLFELMHDQHRIRRWRIGREPGLRALTRDHMLGFYRNFYQPRSTILSIVGDVDPELARRLVEQHYGALGDAAPRLVPGLQETARPTRRYRRLTGDVANWHAAFGWRTPAALHEDTPLLDLAATVLSSGRSSRLYRAVRERRLATSVSAWNYTPTEIGVFVVQLEGEPALIDAALVETWRQCAQLHDGISAAEITRAQRLFESRQLRRLETMDGQANYLADWEALGGWEGAARYDAAVMSATAAQVTDAVRRHLGPEAASLLVYEPTRSAPWATDAAQAFARFDGSEQGTQPQPDAVAELVVPAVIAASPVAEQVINGVHVFRTDGGIPILVRQRAGAPIVHLGVYAGGGAAREPDSHAGIGLLMTRAALKGTTGRDAATIAMQSELLGGGISASSSSDGLGWGLSVPTRAFGEAVTLLSDVVMQPSLGPEAVETERTIARAQLAQVRDDMYRYPTHLAMEAAYGGHPYARGAIGTDEGLAAVSVDDLHQWHSRQVLHGDVVLAVVGDVDPKEAAAVLRRAFATLQYNPLAPIDTPPWLGQGTQRVEPRDKAQTALCMAFPGPSRRDVRRHAAHLVAVIASGLGGRFFDELREKQSLAYTVHVSPSLRAAAGMMQAYIATSPEKEEAAREGLLRQFRRLQEEPVTEEELLRAQTYAIGTNAIAQQSSGHLLGEMIDAWAYGTGLEELGEIEDRIRAVTREAILALAQDCFGAAQRVEGIVRGGGTPRSAP